MADQAGHREELTTAMIAKGHLVAGSRGVLALRSFYDGVHSLAGNCDHVGPMGARRGQVVVQECACVV
eukprot:8996929-Lingulodinium_polyedra.AAC.1